MEKEGKGRLSIGLILLLVGLAVLAGILLIDGTSTGYYAFWRVPVLPQRWADLYSTLLAYQCWIEGIDPYNSLGCNYGPVYFNYPPLILWVLKYTGLGNLSVAALAKGQAVAALASVGLLAASAGSVLKGGKIQTWVALVVLAAIASPAAALAFERGNTDLSMLALGALGCAAWCVWSKQTGRVIGGFLWLFAGCLKIFPWMGWAALLWTKPFDQEPKKWSDYVTPFLLLQVLVLGGYLVWQGPFLLQCLRNTPASQGGFGAATLALFGQVHHITLLSGSFGRWVGVLMAIGLAILLSGLAKRFVDTGVGALPHFWAGLGIYAGAWALGTSYEYRLIFLILPIIALWQVGIVSRESLGLVWVILMLLFLPWIKGLAGAHPAPAVTLLLFAVKYGLALVLAAFAFACFWVGRPVPRTTSL